MQLTSTLAATLNRVWKRDPRAATAFVLSYTGGTMSWSVADMVLTTTVVAGPGVGLSIDLSALTIVELVGVLAGSTGYSVSSINPDLAALSAAVLLDEEGDQAVPLRGFTRLSWAFLDAIALELMKAETATALAPLMMAVTTAQGYWLDFLGTLFGGCLRIPGEPDEAYGARMIAQILAPKGNNVAIEVALESVYGFQNVTVTDVVVYSGAQEYDGTIHFDGTHHFDAAPSAEYGLYDITGTYAGPFPTAQVAPYVSAFLSSLRVAGCHPRNITLKDQGGITMPITLS